MRPRHTYNPRMIGPLFRTMRPKQWVKNLFVLPPLIFAQSLRDPQLLTQAAIAFGGVLCAGEFDLPAERHHGSRAGPASSTEEVPPDRLG